MVNTIIEYLKLHKLSLEQDLDNALRGEGHEFLIGQIDATGHILEYVKGLANES